MIQVVVGEGSRRATVGARGDLRRLPLLLLSIAATAARLALFNGLPAGGLMDSISRGNFRNTCLVYTARRTHERAKRD